MVDYGSMCLSLMHRCQVDICHIFSTIIALITHNNDRLIVALYGEASKHVSIVR
jgi:5,10-methylene-tetrahydrofolate dehydrogenase/methenyl tetrahydrofolate cyclohydrolase